MASQPQKILVAEDNPALSAVIAFNLRRGGFEVTTCLNGKLAWEAAQIQNFDLVVTDHQMPEMTGVELCQNLRSLPAYATCPILMLTAKGLELDLQNLKETLGIAAALPKPFSPTELVATVKKHINEKSHTTA